MNITFCVGCILIAFLNTIKAIEVATDVNHISILIIQTSRVFLIKFSICGSELLKPDKFLNVNA